MGFLSGFVDAVTRPVQLVKDVTLSGHPTSKNALDYLTGAAQAEEQMLYSAQLQQENWEKQYEMSNLYNSPSAQIERLQAAGINPYLSTGGTAQVSSGLNTMSPAASAPTSLTQPKSLMQMVGDAVQAYKTLEEGSVVKPSAEADIGAKKAASRLDEINADREAFNLELDRLFGKDERSAALKNKQQEFFNMVAEMEKLQGDARLAKAQEALTYLKQIQQEFANVGEKYTAGLLKKQHDSYEARLNNELAVGKSEQSKNYATAEEARQAATLHGEQAKEIGFRNEIQSFKNQWFKANKASEMSNYLSALEAEGAISNADYHEAVARCKIAANKGREAWFRYLDWLLDKVNVGANASGAVVGSSSSAKINSTSNAVTTVIK